MLSVFNWLFFSFFFNFLFFPVLLTIAGEGGVERVVGVVAESTGAAGHIRIRTLTVRPPLVTVARCVVPVKSAVAGRVRVVPVLCNCTA